LFRRTPAESPATDPVEKAGGKGRPTPTRKEAEAAARERARLPRDKKAMMRRQRDIRMESSRKMRAAMKSGDPKYLPPRDQGPVRRFIRDMVDSRLRFGDVMIPVFIVILVVQYGAYGTPAARFASALMLPMMLLAVVEIMVIRFRVRREVRNRFPEEPLQGVTLYAVMRAMNMRFMRLPKPQVKIGEWLPETYR
jgi:hypothetical protein